jgi:hypothetical protein
LVTANTGIYSNITISTNEKGNLKNPLQTHMVLYRHEARPGAVLNNPHKISTQ